MKFILLSVFLSLTINAETTYTGDFYESIGVQKDKAIKFLDQSCYVGVAWPMDETGKGKEYFMPDALCVMSATAHAGTVRAKSGCTIVEYNMVKGTAIGTNRNDFGQRFMVMASKDCEKGGFKELLEMETITGSGIKVRDTLKQGKGTSVQPAKLILQYKGFEF